MVFSSFFHWSSSVFWEVARDAHIRGAVNIPYETFERGDGGLPKDKTLIFYCARGGQSMKVCARLSRQGFQTVNLVGGIDHYQGRYLVRG